MAVTTKAPKGKRPNRTAPQLGTSIDTAIREAMMSYIAEYNETAEHEATIRTTVEAALKAFLRSKSFWPPARRASTRASSA